MSDKKRVSDMIEEILIHTNGGYTLSPKDYALLNLVIVDREDLQSSVKQPFEKLYQAIMDGSYKEPWLHDIEGMTVDHSGFIKYEDHIIEHFDLEYAYDEAAIPELLELRERALYLKEHGYPICSENTVWRWEAIQAQENGMPHEKEEYEDEHENDDSFER